MLTINTNIPSLNAQRAQTRNQSALGTALQRLSSGLRINSARDDAAGLAISSRMTTQILGLGQARRNINDAVSMSQTAEGALGELTGLMQRGRELAIQAANATNSTADRNALQAEIDQIVEEVQRISDTAAFNSVKLFEGGGDEVTYDPDSTGLTPEQQRVLDSLKTSWLEQSEAIVTQYLGISASSADLEIIFETDTGAADAFVTRNGSTVELHINTNTFISVMDAQGDWPNQPLDNLIAHEMVHAVMVATTSLGTNPAAMPKWFSEGIAEFLPGGDLRLNNVLQTSTAQDVIDELDNIQGSNWDTTNIQYAAAYTATRMLHEEIKTHISADGVKHLMEWMAADDTRTLDQYFTTVLNPGGSAYTSADDFIDNGVQADGGDAGTDADGVDFINSLTLNNLDDTGAIGGGESDGGARDTSWAGTVPDIANFTNNPLAGFAEIFPSSEARPIELATTRTLDFQVGANANEIISLDLVGINANNLGIADIDLVNDAQLAITQFDSALGAINSERARLGAIQNRLEMAASNTEIGVENISASRSRIMDADFATETATLTRSNILVQAGVAMVAQSNTLPSLALSLLST